MAGAIEGVDYIFDRYAFLGLEINASKEDIKQAVRTKRAGLHPDRLVNVDEDIKARAEAKRNLVDKSAAILLNDNLRPLYDTRLKEFYEKDPRLVSRDGHEIINLSEERFSIDTLLSEEIPDIASFEKRIRDATQFDEKNFEQAKTLYESMPDNEQIRNLYKTALTDKLVYFELLEDAAWALIGYTGKKHKTGEEPVLFPEDYTQGVETEIGRVREEVIETAVQERNEALRIGVAAPLLLLEDKSVQNENGGRIATMDEDTIERIRTEARKKLEIRADYIRDIAKQKQEVLKELVAFADVRELSPRNPDDPVYEIYMALPNENTTVLARFNVEASKAHSKIDDSFTPGIPLEEALKHVRQTNALLLVKNMEITDMFMEVAWLGTKISEEWQQAHKPAEPQHAPAP